MPITQDRMLDLIEAAAAFRNSSRSMSTSIHYYQKSVAAGTSSLSEALTQIAMLADTPLPPRYYETILREELHFKHRGRRNERQRELMERRRREEGVPEQQSKEAAAYSSFNKSSSDPSSSNHSAATIPIRAAPRKAAKLQLKVSALASTSDTAYNRNTPDGKTIFIELDPKSATPEDFNDGIF